MDVVCPDDAAAFLDEAERLLLGDEARHNLILGLAGSIRAEPSLYSEQRFWLVRDGRRAVAAALWTPPYNLVLARPASELALDALVDGVAVEDLPGVVGSLPEVGSFAERWARAHAVTPRRTMTQWVYQLEHVEGVARPSGDAREADAGDRKLAVRWWHEFTDEVFREGAPGRERTELAVEHRLADADSGILLWEDRGQVVSLASWGGPTPHGIRIGPVYTPRSLRGHGYATALVAELSQRLLDDGRRFCFLYTDAANPTSNAIYERIGYVRVCESAEIAFERR